MSRRRSLLLLIILAGIDGVFGNDCTSTAVYDHGAGSLHEQENSNPCQGPADAQVSESAGAADADRAGGIDLVILDSPDCVIDVDDRMGPEGVKLRVS